jgi:hypothetical protein
MVWWNDLWTECEVTQLPFKWLCAINNSVIYHISFISEDSGLLGFETVSVWVVPSNWKDHGAFCFSCWTGQEEMPEPEDISPVWHSITFCLPNDRASHSVYQMTQHHILFTKWHSITLCLPNDTPSHTRTVDSSVTLQNLTSYTVCVSNIQGCLIDNRQFISSLLVCPSFGSVLRRAAVPMSDALRCVTEL